MFCLAIAKDSLVKTLSVLISAEGAGGARRRHMAVDD